MRKIFLFFAAILCAMSTWAYNVPAGYYVYFEKPSGWSQASLLLGHNSYSIGYSMTKIDNTSLYYWKTDKWDGYTEYFFMQDKWGSEGSSPTHRNPYAGSNKTSVFKNEFQKYHLFTTAGSKSSHATDRKAAINRTQTIKVQLKDGENWVDATVVPADLTASTYAMTDNSTAVSAASASLTKESTIVSATVSAAYSATVTLACTNVLDGYVFEGWYDANGNKITSYTVSDAHTIQARFIQSAEETNEVSVTYMCDATEVSPAIAEIVGVETEKSFTAPTVTGYQFTNWTIGAGIDLKAGTATDATITVVTKSASSDYTLVANYKEVQETVYFINAGKWSEVHLHLWNGNAVGTEWPGTQLTATGEKIGEYDVYSYTAKQGDHLNLLFHENTGDVNKTTDLTWAEGVDKYYIHNYNGNTGWYTQSDAEELLVVPVVYETVYFVNNKNWSLVQIHAWNGSSNNGWPGQALTATGEKVEGFDVYSFEAAQGTYTNLIFNNKEGDAGEQSENYVWTADKYYYMGADSAYAGGTKEEVAVLVAPDPLATEVYLVGEMNSWNTTANEFKKATAEATTASVTVALSATTTDTCEFKLFIGGEWKGNNGTMQRGGVAVHESGWSFEEDGNCKIVADIAGDYTFTWDLTTKKLTVTYPELPKYTVTATSENGTIEGIENEGVYTQGAEVTLTATAAEGYHFVKWDDESTDNPRIITVTENVTLQAIFEINNYTITASTTREKLTQTIAIDGDNADWANIPMLSEPGVGPMVKMIVPQEGATLPEGAAYALMIAGDEEHVKAGYPKIFTDADKDNTTPLAAWFSPNMGFDYELATWSTGSKYAANTAGTIREMCIMQAAYDKDGFGFDGSVWGVLYFSTPSEYFIPAATTSSWKSTYRPFIVEPTQYVYNPLAGTHAAADVYATHAALPKGESFRMFNNSGDTAFWAAWTVELSQPAIYNVATSWTTDNGSSVDLYLIDAKTNTIVATFEGGWNSTATGVEEYGKWDLTNVPAGKYVLKMKNHVSWSNMVFNAVTLTPQDDVVIANTITGSGNYNHGAEVTLTATPATGYEFVEWSDGETANPYTFTATKEVNLTATFQKKSYTVTIVKEATNQTIAIDGNNSDWAKIPMLSEPGVSPMVKMIVPQEGVSLPEGAAYALMVQGDEEYIKAEYPKIYTDYDKSNTTGSVRWWCNAMGSDLSVTKSTSGTLYNANAESTIREMCVMQSSFSMPFTGSVWTWLYFEESDVFVPQNASEAGWAWSETSCFPLDVKSYSYTDIANTHAANTVYANHSALIFDKTIQFNKLYYWAAWAVELITPAVYTISMDVSATNTTTLDLYLVNVATNEVVKTFVGEEKWAPEGEIAYGEWDLSDVPVGKYMLKAMSHTSGTDMQITSVTLTPQESNVEIESAEHILTGDGTYLYGEVATLNATPAIGYNFVNWSNGKTANPYSFIVTEDVEIAANFQKKIYTVAATAENGTVTGLVEGGKYEHGATATLTATPAFDYQFVNWSNGSTENPLTITVTDNVTLEAIFAEVAATTVAESGVFSISAHKTATFATGNLQYNVGTQTWRFAKQQYQVVGEQNINLGDPAFTGWIDMLGWSNGEANNYGVNPSNKNEYYAGEFVDWGTKMGEGWSTLSAEEWSYLLNTRENAASLKQTAKVDTIIGLLLFPDGWVMPEGVVVEAEMDEYFEVNIYNYTLEQWTKLEQAGAIFLPAAGRRTGGYGNMINYDQVEETDENKLNGGFYRHQDNTNIYCYYWTSTINAETKKVSYLHNVLALGNDEYTIGNGAIWGEKGRYGQSVRLAKVAYDKHTVTATAENGTVEGAGTYEHGTEVTLTATANEGYEFVKWSNESTENPLTITVTEDVTISAIFQEVVPVYTITFDYNVDAGYITVNDVRISEKEVTYEEGTELTVKALTFNDWRFDAWQDEEQYELMTTPEYTFTVTGDVVLNAIFTPEKGAVGTGVENNNVVSSKTMKVIQNGRLMIIREGKTYNAQGQMIE